MISCAAAQFRQGIFTERPSPQKRAERTVGIATSGLAQSGGWAGLVLALASLCCASAVADSPPDVDPPPPPDRPALWAVSEIRAGSLEHDTTGLWSGFTLERAAADANLEILFTPWARTF